jgi:hypothetical protein
VGCGKPFGVWERASGGGQIADHSPRICDLAATARCSACVQVSSKRFAISRTDARPAARRRASHGNEIQRTGYATPRIVSAAGRRRPVLFFEPRPRGDSAGSNAKISGPPGGSLASGQHGNAAIQCLPRWPSDARPHSTRRQAVNQWTWSRSATNRRIILTCCP